MKLLEVIQLRGFVNPNTEPFMQDFIASTTEAPMGKGRLYGSVLLDVSQSAGGIRISDIMSAGEKGQGAGTEALKFLTALADHHNVRLSGNAQAYSKDDEHIQDSDRLITWYKKHGFAVSGDKISYTPKRKH